MSTSPETETRTQDCARRVTGFTLVEVLIAMVIMAIGMLGIAGMYVHSLQAGRTSILRTQAVTLAADVADRIRANPRGGINYVGVGTDNNCTGNTRCTPGQLAAYDVWLWNQQRDLAMPAGASISVRYDDAVPNQPPIYSVNVQWPEAGQTPSYKIRFGAAEF